MIANNTAVIVIGGLHTDIIASGVTKIAGPGELVVGNELKIGPGGKSRNIAQMIATLTDKGTVAMIGKTSKDPYGLWKFPVEALEQSGVNSDFVQQVPFDESKKFPAVALIPVDREGNNQIYVLPGINEEFFPDDIDKAKTLFQTVEKNNGMVTFSLELPLQTAIHAIKKARTHGLPVLLDPGGLQEGVDYTKLLEQEIFLLKPNEHEAKLLTGITVTDFDSAKSAAAKLLKKNISYVFITHGRHGGYLFGKEISQHIQIPKIKPSTIRDATGAGDQTMATLSALLLEKKDIMQAAKSAILAGTLQFQKSGIVPVTREEIYTYQIKNT